LIEHFIRKNNLLREKKINGFSQEALAILMSYDFPGNIRELENIVEHAFVLCREGQITPHCLPEKIVGLTRILETSLSVDGTIKAMEAKAIREALEHNHNNRLAAARELGMHKSTFFRKIKKLGIDLPKKNGRSKLK